MAASGLESVTAGGGTFEVGHWRLGPPGRHAAEASSGQWGERGAQEKTELERVNCNSIRTKEPWEG